MTEKTVLVVGVSGFVGRAVAQAFLETRSWRVIGLSRHLPKPDLPGLEHIAVDLCDDQACHLAVGAVRDASHIVYAAVNETPGDLVASWSDPHHAERNGRMFARLMDAVQSAAAPLEHVSLMHGTKAYAVHRGETFRHIPLRESQARPDNDDFYFRQEDELWSRQVGRPWHWTVLRAPTIAGGGWGSNLNSLLAVAVYAELRRAACQALSFPGAPAPIEVLEMVDVRLLARAAVWAATAVSARNQIFNVANGDTFSWQDLWPVIAGEIGLPVGDGQPLSLGQWLPAQNQNWAELVGRYDLTVPSNIQAYLGESGALADFLMGSTGKPVLTSTIKIRQAGFHDCIDTAESLLYWIRHWREQGMLPPR